MNPLYLLGYTLGLGVNLIARPLVDNKRLRAALADTQAENDALARVAADLAGQLAVAIRDDLAALDACDTYDDFLYATGDDA